MLFWRPFGWGQGPSLNCVLCVFKLYVYNKCVLVVCVQRNVLCGPFGWGQGPSLIVCVCVVCVQRLLGWRGSVCPYLMVAVDPSDINERKGSAYHRGYLYVCVCVLGSECILCTQTYLKARSTASNIRKQSENIDRCQLKCYIVWRNVAP